MSNTVKHLIENEQHRLLGEFVHVIINKKRRTLEIVGVISVDPKALFVAGENGRLSLAANTVVELQESPFLLPERLHGDYLL